MKLLSVSLCSANSSFSHTRDTYLSTQMRIVVRFFTFSWIAYKKREIWKIDIVKNFTALLEIHEPTIKWFQCKNNYHMRVGTFEWKQVIGFNHKIIPSVISRLFRRCFFRCRFWKKIGRILKACNPYLFVFYRKKAFPKLWKLFLFHLKSFFHFQYFWFFVPFFPNFP